jgi:hypothetical protein
MRELMKRHPFTTYGVLALGLFVIIDVLNLQYDDGGIGTLLILSSPVWGFVYWAPSEVLFKFNDGRAFEGHFVISIMIGLFICLLADYVLSKKLSHNVEKETSTSA